MFVHRENLFHRYLDRNFFYYLESRKYLLHTSILLCTWFMEKSLYTVCQVVTRFTIVTYHIKWVTTSWTDGNYNISTMTIDYTSKS